MELSGETLATYCRVAIQGMRRALNRFDDASVNLKPGGDQSNSAAVLIVHSCTAAIYWLSHIGIGNEVERDRAKEFQTHLTVSELHSVLDKLEANLVANALELGAIDERDHELRSLLPENDRSNSSVALYVMIELFQHLGHLEVTADALGL